MHSCISNNYHLTDMSRHSEIQNYFSFKVCRKQRYEYKWFSCNYKLENGKLSEMKKQIIYIELSVGALTSLLVVYVPSSL